MPSAYYGFLTNNVEALLKYRPKSVCIIGVGFGRDLFLAREYLDVFCKFEYGKEHWHTRIDCIEVFEPYILPHHRELATNIYIGDAKQVLPTLPDFDMIIAGDVLEHWTKPEALEMLEMIRKKSKVSLLVTPLGNRWPQPKFMGNDYEEHKSIWEESDFVGAKELVVKHNPAGKPIAWMIFENA